jgi:hypothetical protein
MFPSSDEGETRTLLRHLGSANLTRWIERLRLALSKGLNRVCVSLLT